MEKYEMCKTCKIMKDPKVFDYSHQVDYLGWISNRKGHSPNCSDCRNTLNANNKQYKRMRFENYRKLMNLKQPEHLTKKQ